MKQTFRFCSLIVAVFCAVMFGGHLARAADVSPSFEKTDYASAAAPPAQNADIFTGKDAPQPAAMPKRETCEFSAKYVITVDRLSLDNPCRNALYESRDRREPEFVPRS